MSERLDVVGIGNAMVDVIIKSNLDTIKNYGVNHDSMNLIDEEKIEKFDVKSYPMIIASNFDLILKN